MALGSTQGNVLSDHTVIIFERTLEIVLCSAYILYSIFSSPF